MSTALHRKNTVETETETETAAKSPVMPGANPAVIVEDETFAGPAPDDDASLGNGRLLDPQAGIAPVVAPAESLLRFITCGSVDDGKSTLIGRLLYETNAVFDDQMEALKKDSRKFGTTGGDLDFALLVDGLSAEREQGITIDVAYRYFSTASRAFIIADTPGHEQYTRNMATGASQAELAVILVDARKGILPQTRRHSFITSLVGIKSVVVAVNKMDLVDFDEARFETIKREYEALLPNFGFTDVSYIPLSAKNGDNIVTPSPNTPWYTGETLLQRLETATPTTFDAAASPFRLPVQRVNRPNLDFRGFAGTIVGGAVKPGDAVAVMPGNRRTHVKGVWGPNGEIDGAENGEAVTLTLADEVDVSRGDVLVAANDTITAERTIKAQILWMSDKALVSTGRYVAMLAASTIPASVGSLDKAIDIHSFEAKPANALQMNEIGEVTLSFDRPVVVTPYEASRELGSFILIDPLSNETMALGVVRSLAGKGTGTAAPLVTDGTPSARERLTHLWFGDEGADSGEAGTAERNVPDRRAVVRYRAAAAVFFVFIAFLFGLNPLLAIPLALIDFLVRPFLRIAFGATPATKKTIPESTSVGDGAGI